MAAQVPAADDGPDAAADPVYAADVATATGVTSCSWAKLSEADGSGDPAFTVAVYPGAAWYLATFRAAIDATSTSVTGFPDAVEVDPQPGEDFQRIGDSIAVADGVNLVVVSWNNVPFANRSTVLPSLLAAVNRD
jgi:hypothetical protein